jgi:hypothetical protein
MMENSRPLAMTVAALRSGIDFLIAEDRERKSRRNIA